MLGAGQAALLGQAANVRVGQGQYFGNPLHVADATVFVRAYELMEDVKGG